jgi:NAD+ synthase (glutamine-hydrolysing)
MLKVTLSQINPCVGDLSANAKAIIAAIKKAKLKKADLVVFGELALTGYPPEDLLLKSHFIEENKKLLKKISKETKGIAALVGFVDKKANQIYNACAYIHNGVIKDIYYKNNLANYGVFDEKRYFTAGKKVPVFKLGNYRFCISICEDIWNSDFVSLLKNEKPDFIVNASASPFHLGKVVLREKILCNAAAKTKAFIFYCNLIGGQDELVFDGTSKVISPQGKVISYAKRFEPDSLLFNLDTKKNYPAKKIVFHEDEEAYLALHLGLSDYVDKNGFGKVVVGVSGGIDSAVVISLATFALGKKNVEALIMPSRYTSKGTLSDAKAICKNLGVKYSVINIDGIFDSYLSLLKPHFKGKRPDKTEENIQARIRGNILMAFSNKFGHMVLNTGNKSEFSCGYCTLYGDMVGGFGLLKDVPKMLVYRLARYINKISKKNVIPKPVLEKAPSAELRPNQKDSDTLPEYKLLDPILKLYVEDDYSLEKIVKKGYSKQLVKKVVSMVDANEYKRRQGPVGIKITPRAFGRDRRMPITNRYSE